MSKQYKIGYYYERKVKQILEKDGYLVWRSPSSKYTFNEPGVSVYIIKVV